jgi:hypothetical protein
MVATIGRFASPVPSGSFVGTPPPNVMPPGMANLGGQFRSWVEQNPQTVSNLSAGLLSGGTFRDSLARASATIAPSMAADKLERDRQAKIASLTKWVRAQQEAGRVIPPATLEAIGANPDIASALLTKSAVNDFGLGDPTDRYKAVGDKIFDQQTATFITPPGGATGGMFSGNSVDAQSLNWLVNNKILTPQQAAEVGAGKTVIGADGLQYFFTPQGLAGTQGGIAPAGAVVPPVNTPAPAPAPVAGGNSLITPAPVATTAAGPRPLFGPNAAKDTDTLRTNRGKAAVAAKSLKSQLDTFVALVGGDVKTGTPGTGIVAAFGSEKDAVNTVRQTVLMEMKELLNLGVLNGPDLQLLNTMLYDPSVDTSAEGGIARLPDQIWTGITGNAGVRAKNNADQIKAYLDRKIEAFNALPPPPPGSTSDAPTSDAVADPLGIR